METRIKKAIRGDADAFAELVMQYKTDMYKVARGIINNQEDVADAISNTILKCYENIGKLEQPKYFKTWMTRILINECNQIIRRYGNQSLLEVFPEIPWQDASMETVEFEELMQALDEKYRVVLVLYYAQGYKIAEIADLLDIPEGTVKTRLARGREMAAKEYGADTKKSEVLPLRKEAM